MSFDNAGLLIHCQSQLELTNSLTVASDSVWSGGTPRAYASRGRVSTAILIGNLKDVNLVLTREKPFVKSTFK
jgi:hypothetical protein